MFAQVSPDVGTKIIEALSDNGLWVMIAICVLAGTSVDIVKRVLRHRERVAMIQAGMHPDSTARSE